MPIWSQKLKTDDSDASSFCGWVFAVVVEGIDWETTTAFGSLCFFQCDVFCGMLFVVRVCSPGKSHSLCSCGFLAIFLQARKTSFDLVTGMEWWGFWLMWLRGWDDSGIQYREAPAGGGREEED